jgi:uncharacterized protein YkwD
MKRLMTLALSLMLAVTAVFAFPSEAFAAKYKTVTGKLNYNYIHKVLELVNEEREAAGVDPLVMTESLCESAMIRATEISVEFSHTRPNGDFCTSAVQWVGSVGENIAWGQNTPENVVDSWMNSKAHRENILRDSFGSIGVGCFVDGGMYYWTQVFSGASGKAYKTKGTYEITAKVSLTAGVNSKISGWPSDESNANTLDEDEVLTDDNGDILDTSSSDSVTESGAIKTSALKLKLSPSKYSYNGKARKPKVIVTDKNGKTVSKDYYTVYYSSGRKKVGKYKVVVEFKGKYVGTLKKTFKIVPKKTKITSLKAGKKAFTVNWKKISSQTTGYQVQYAANSAFTKNKKTVSVSPKSKKSKIVKKLKGGKKYYVRVRTYKISSGKVYYSKWSAVKTVTTKK